MNWFSVNYLHELCVRVFIPLLQYAEMKKFIFFFLDRLLHDESSALFLD